MKQKNELHKNLKPYIRCKDYTVSNEVFQVLFNEEYEMLVTQPVPKNLESYYKSQDYISHTDSKKKFFDKVYQAVKNVTLKQKLSLINSFNISSKTILDVGAGTGDFLKTCKNNQWEIFGIEPNELARKIAATKGVFLKKDISEIKNKKFDVISLWHVLEHVPNLKEYISVLKNSLKNKGKIIIAVPNYKSFDASYYKEFWAAYDVPRHLWHFSQNSIHKLFSEVDMKVEKIKPLLFDSFYVSLLSEKYKNRNTNPLKAFYVGLLSNYKAKSSSEYSSLIYVIKPTKNPK